MRQFAKFASVWDNADHPELLLLEGHSTVYGSHLALLNCPSYITTLQLCSGWLHITTELQVHNLLLTLNKLCCSS